jgi:hypothetical protein
VVQAEIRPDGKTMYGVIGDGDVRAITNDQVLGITPIAEKKNQKAK